VCASSATGSFIIGILVGITIAIGVMKLSTHFKKKSDISFLDASSKEVAMSPSIDHIEYDEIQVRNDGIKYSLYVIFDPHLMAGTSI